MIPTLHTPKNINSLSSTFSLLLQVRKDHKDFDLVGQSSNLAVTASYCSGVGKQFSNHVLALCFIFSVLCFSLIAMVERVWIKGLSSFVHDC